MILHQVKRVHRSLERLAKHTRPTLRNKVLTCPVVSCKLPRSRTSQAPQNSVDPLLASVDHRVVLVDLVEASVVLPKEASAVPPKEASEGLPKEATLQVTAECPLQALSTCPPKSQQSPKTPLLDWTERSKVLKKKNCMSCRS